ncbi:hypothetical protein NNRS527_02073 [Nitrosospira sp. NRS527]|nr:hypothetical protein NNRS527_02073 [Nitrosospira sp. NRS527]
MGWVGCDVPNIRGLRPMLTAVSELETYATLPTGLGLLGFMSHAARVFKPA